MIVKTLAAAALVAGALAVVPHGAEPASSPLVDFRTHDIEAKFPGGYALTTVDINHDGKLDVVGVSQRVQEMAWYENPSWERHVMAEGFAGIVNLAAADLDGDGIPEIAFENSFTMSPKTSEGIVWVMKHKGDPRQPWETQQIDKFPTSHHLAWADIDGDGKKELINAPLIGANGAPPTYDQDKVPIFFYGQNDWKRRVMADSISGIVHRVRPVQWDDGKREQVLVTSFEGITLYRASGSGASLKWTTEQLSPGHSMDKAPRLGTSDVAVGKQRGKRFLAAVEPWHGNEIVVYTQNGAKWDRKVLFDGMTEGHEVAIADLNGDGLEDVVAGDRNSKSPAVHVMYAPADPSGEWTHQVLDEGKMAASGCVTADLNGDKRPDIVCIGSSSANLKWYENLGKK